MFSLQNWGKVSPSSRVHCSARLGIIVAIYYGEEKSAGCVASGMTMESHKTRWRCGRRRRSLPGHCEATPERLLAGKESHETRCPTGAWHPTGQRGQPRARTGGWGSGPSTLSPSCCSSASSSSSGSSSPARAWQRITPGHGITPRQGTALQQGSSASAGISRSRTPQRHLPQRCPVGTAARAENTFLPKKNPNKNGKVLHFYQG